MSRLAGAIKGLCEMFFLTPRSALDSVVWCISGKWPAWSPNGARFSDLDATDAFKESSSRRSAANWAFDEYNLGER